MTYKTHSAQLWTDLDLLVGQRIEKVAVSRGFDHNFLINLAWCESTHKPHVVNGCYAGLYQWDLCSTGIIEEECAFDIECSTNFTIDALERGEYWRWPNCP